MGLLVGGVVADVEVVRAGVVTGENVDNVESTGMTSRNDCLVPDTVPPRVDTTNNAV